MPLLTDPRPRPTADAARRHPGRRSALGLALAAVLGAHLWVIDAWSLPVVAPATARPAPQPVTALAAPDTPRPALVEPAPAPVTARPRVQRRAPAAAASATRAPPATDTDTDTAADADVTPTPLQLARATVSVAPAAAAVSASEALTAPPSVRLHYRMHKGPLAGTGQLDWERDADTYRMRLEARVPIFGQIFLETSQGRVDASGLAPLRHTERRIRRSERAVSFVRDQGRPRILFSAREGEEPLHPGTQDRLSWIAQLATRMTTPPAGEWRAGSRIEMDVASTGGDVQRWIFTVQGRDSAGLWQLRREPDSPRDTRADVWIDPGHHHWPVRIRLSESSGDPLELILDGQPPG